jgi:hypothetical protein
MRVCKFCCQLSDVRSEIRMTSKNPDHRDTNNDSQPSQSFYATIDMLGC